MAKRKYESWMEENKLEQLQQWAGKGYSDRKIAEMAGVSQSTLISWKREYPKIREALEGGRKTDNRQVEHALLKRALGYSYMETTYERTGDEENEKMVVKKQVEKQVMPDLTAQAFWLKNRNPEKWKDKQDMKWDGKDITVRLIDEEDEN